MTPKEEAKELLVSFSKVKNIVYLTVKDPIIKNVIVQNATIHCQILIQEEIDNSDENTEGNINRLREVIKQLKIIMKVN